MMVIEPEKLVEPFAEPEQIISHSILKVLIIQTHY